MELDTKVDLSAPTEIGETNRIQKSNSKENDTIQKSGFGDNIEIRDLQGLRPQPGTTNGLIQLVQKQLTDKQDIIDKQALSIEERNQAITVLGNEMHELRAANRSLQSRLLEAERIISENADEKTLALHSAEKALQTAPRSLEKLNKQVLLQVLYEVLKRYQGVEKEREEFSLMIDDGKAARRQFVELEKKFKELQEAHMLQSKFIHKLQGQHGKVDSYRATIVTQEKIITKMQSVIERNLKNGHIRMSKDDVEVQQQLHQEQEEGAALIQKLEEMTKQLESANNEIGTLSTRLKELESLDTNLLAEQLAQSKRKVDELEAELDTKDIRIQAVEAQLHSSAKESSKEISRLRTKLFEFEISMAMDNDGAKGLGWGNLAGGWDDDDDFVPSVKVTEAGRGGVKAVSEDLDSKPTVSTLETSSGGAHIPSPPSASRSSSAALVSPSRSHAVGAPGEDSEALAQALSRTPSGNAIHAVNSLRQSGSAPEASQETGNQVSPSPSVPVTAQETEKQTLQSPSVVASDSLTALVESNPPSVSKVNDISSQNAVASTGGA